MEQETEVATEDLFNEAYKMLMEHALSTTPSGKKWTPEEAEKLYEYAYHFYRGGKYQDAVDFFRTLTSIDSMDCDYWEGLAGSLKMLGQFEKALEAYTICAIIDGRNPLIHAHAADCCFALGQIERGMYAINAAEIQANGNKKYTLLLSQLAVIKKAWSNKD
jgi:type III secretion system low calcium response chaperone LcrH/SycD